VGWHHVDIRDGLRFTMKAGDAIRIVRVGLELRRPRDLRLGDVRIVVAIFGFLVVLAGLAVEAPTGAVVAAGVVAFLAVWGALFSLQRLNLRVLRHSSTRFPTPPDER
jgi:hypothetical protein